MKCLNTFQWDIVENRNDSIKNLLSTEEKNSLNTFKSITFKFTFLVLNKKFIKYFFKYWIKFY